MPLDRSRVEQALAGKFKFEREDTDHRYFTLEVDGKVVTTTKTSHGSSHREIGDNLVSQMARQVHVSRSYFEGMVRCTRSREDYLTSLHQRGLLKPNE